MTLDRPWPLHLLAACAFLLCIAPASGLETRTPEAPLQFSGRALLVASDGDMVGTAYADGILGRAPDLHDALTAVALPLNPSQPKTTSLPVSSSVIPWPADLAVSPDGKFAFVAEGRQPGSPSDQRYDDVYTGFPAGGLLSVVSLANPSAPRATQAVSVGRNPVAVAVSPDGRWLAIGTEEPGAELVLAPVSVDGTIGPRTPFAVPRVEPGPAKSVGSVAWHPSGRYFALNVANRHVAFFSFSRQSDGRPSIRPLGALEGVGQCLSIGRFTPDGRHYVASDVAWGEKPFGFLFNGPGQLLAIRFDTDGRHELASRATVGISPEGFAMSPDGTLLAAVNMNRTYLPRSFPLNWWPQSGRSSVSLVSLDAHSGRLSVLSEQLFEGGMPEHATFDASGRGLAITIYHDRIDAPREGWVEFWNVERSPAPRLVQTVHRLSVPRGAHTIALVP